MTHKPNKTAQLEAELWDRIEVAKAHGDTDTYALLCRVQAVLWQYKAVTPNKTLDLPCQDCGTTGRHQRWNHAIGAYIDVFCHWCQGSGMTWNPHPTAYAPHIKGEM